MSATANINKLISEIPDDVRLVAVSKTKPNSAIMSAYNGGFKVFGENKVQDLVEKYEHLPKDIEWHFIGHLQRNKVKFIAPFVSLIHGVESEKLLKEINKRGANEGRKIPILLQVFIADEITKFGLNEEETTTLVEKIKRDEFPFVELRGLMGMATNSQDEDKVRKEFASLKKLYDRLVQSGYALDTLSMGMSGDHELAIQEGSNMIRVGSKIFGARK